MPPPRSVTMPCTSDRPEAGADADLLRREERIEDALEHVRRDAGAGVAHAQAHIAAGRQRAGRGDRSFERRDVERHGEHAAALHRLDRIRAQVHHHLVHLRRIAHHRRIAGRQLALDAHARRQRCGRRVERFFDDRLHVHRHALAHAAATEREDALDQRLRAHGRRSARRRCGAAARVPSAASFCAISP